MKKFILILFIVHCSLFIVHCFSQDQHLIDSLTNELKKHKQDTTATNILYALSKACWSNNPDKAMEYAIQTLALSEQIGYKKGIGNAYNSMGSINCNKGDYLLALEFHKKALKIREEIGDKKGIAGTYNNIGIVYMYQGNYSESLKNYFAALKINEESGNKNWEAYNLNNIGIIYTDQNNYPEALKNYFSALKIREEIGDKYGIASSYNNIGNIYYYQSNYPEALKNFYASLKISEEIGDKKGIATSYINIGNICSNQGNYTEALKNLYASLKISEEIGNKYGISASFYDIGTVYTKQKKYNEASEYLNKGLSVSKEVGSLEVIRNSYEGLVQLDSAQGNFNKALEHYKLFISFRDSLVNKENTKKIVQQQMQYDFDKKQVADSLKYVKEKEIGALLLQRQKAITWTGFAGVALTMLFLFLMYRGFRKQKRSNHIIEETNAALHIVNNELKDTQAQLVQQEKLASLGALTAGIAHEIKNPLNFVNNFAELSNDLLEELKTAGSQEEKNEIMTTLKQNLEKINQHGKRADGIVKSMLEHSRSGTGEKQPADINKLCDEYLNLAYHGMRAGVKDFNCNIERHFAENLPKLNIVPQDISRVLLNLINNAFYALKDKADATLTLTTLASGNSVVIKIKDNGTGIPEDVKKKIFEPFYTTKPSGSGTGLGLSLSFDIIKAHGGKIEVDSKENEYTEFKITIPV
jgi:two-component system, NtrC family, sensor kinase